MLYEYITSNQSGGTFRTDGLDVEYGKVSQYYRHLNRSIINNPFNFVPTYCCHLDRISAKRKRQIERDYGLPPSCISTNKVKADIFFIASDNTPYFVSVKDIETPSKLGQVMAETSYCNARLKGGFLDLVLPQHSIPEIIHFRDTALTEEQFKKAGKKDRRYAFFKNKFNSEWLELVRPIEDNAQRQLRQFVEIIKTDKESLVEFIGTVLAGSLRNSSDFYILLGGERVQITKFLSALESLHVQVEIEEDTPPGSNKTSMIIWLTVQNTRYCLTRIEFSFDGKKLISNRGPVCQTKGIVYYFQQHLGSGNHYKKLLLDITQ